MTGVDVNANLTSPEVVTLLDKDGAPFEASNPLPASDAGLSKSVTRQLVTSDDCSSTPADLTGAPGASLKAVAMDIVLSVDTDCEVHILTESGADLCGMFLSAKSPVQLTLRGFLKGATVNKKLQLTTSVAAKVRGACVWFAEA